MPQVTIGLPFFNDRSTLADAIRSVLAQSFTNWELLLVDDGSSDGSLELARLIRDPRVRVLSDGVNRKLAARLNQIAREARGTLIARMDAGDLMHPERIARQVAAFSTRPDLSILGTATYTINERGVVMGVRGDAPLDARPGAVLRHGLFIHPTVMMRTDWARLNRYDESLPRVQDLDLWYRIAGQASVHLLPEPLHFYREPWKFNIRNYRLSADMRLRLLDQYGPASLGRSRTMWLKAAVRARAAVYGVLQNSSWSSWLVARRSRAVDVAQKQLAQTCIDRVREHALPNTLGARTGPRITVGIPFYNARSTLAAAVRSVFAQTISDWELLLVDDGSTDGSLELARAIKDPRVKVISDGKNLKLAARLNQISQLASAPLVARMDADDLMVPERLEKQLAFLSAHPEIELMGSSAIAIDAADRPHRMRGSEPVPRSHLEVLGGGLFVHPTVVARKAWALANPYSLDYLRAEDYELWARGFGKALSAVLPEPLLLYREPTQINLGAYRLTQRAKRSVVWLYGPENIGYGASLRLVIATVAKETIYRLARTLGGEARLVRLRGRPLSEASVKIAQDALERINATQVPGL